MRNIMSCVFLLLTLFLVSCAKSGPELGSDIRISGTIVDMSEGGSRDFLIQSGGKLYHFGTRLQFKWSKLRAGHYVTVDGKFGGPCEEASMFRRYMYDDEGNFIKSLEVYDIIHVSNVERQ
ncbi:MAG: hypothetical protein ABIJ92_04360 [Candidatus Aenigmatarchaeota archaeon]